MARGKVEPEPESDPETGGKKAAKKPKKGNDGQVATAAGGSALNTSLVVQNISQVLYCISHFLGSFRILGILEYTNNS